MLTILSTMLRGIFRDMHTLFWNIIFPIGLLIGLGLYIDNSAYSNRLLSGVLTMNILFGATITTAFSIISYRNRGVYKLIRATPFSTFSLISAMTGARTILALFVSICVVIIGVFALGVTLNLISMFLMLFVLLIGSICFTAIGFIAANLSRDEGNVSMISNVIAFPMIFTSEAFYSLENAPQWIQVFSKLHPFYYLVEGMGIAVNGGEGAIADIWQPLGILAIFTVLFMTIATVTFRWDNERTASRKAKNRVQNYTSA
jgi:ABC-2 type transport system permease protein